MDFFDSDRKERRRRNSPQTIAGLIVLLIFYGIFQCMSGGAEGEQKRLYNEAQENYLQPSIKGAKELIESAGDDYIYLSSEFIPQYQEKHPQIEEEKINSILTRLQNEKEKVIKDLQKLIPRLESVTIEDMPEKRMDMLMSMSNLQAQWFRIRNHWNSFTKEIKNEVIRMVSDNSTSVDSE